MPLIRLAYLIGTLFLATQIFAACAQSETTQDDTMGAADEASLLQTVNAYNAAADARDFENVISLSMPEKILTIVMEQPNASEADITTAHTEMVSAIEAAYATIEEFDYQYDLTDIDILTTPSGLNYALLPTVTNVSLSGLSLKSTGTTLALHDENQWFLLNPQDEESIGWFRRAYPSLENVDLQPNQMEVVQ